MDTKQIVDLIKVADHADAVELLERALAVAHSEGASNAAKQVSESMIATFDKVVGWPQSEAIKRLREAGA